jgi:hypothetical protein
MCTEQLVEYVEGDDSTVALVGDSAYKLTDESPLETHELGDDSLLVISRDEYYEVDESSNGWLIPSSEMPTEIVELLSDEFGHRVADWDIDGKDVSFDVGFRSDNSLYSSAWQSESVRPGSEVLETISDSIKEVTLTVELSEEGTLTVTDFELWPNNSSVEVDI